MEKYMDYSRSFAEKNQKVDGGYTMFMGITAPSVNMEFLLNGEGNPLLPERPPTAEERRQRLIDSIRDIFDQLDPSVQTMIEEAIVNRQKARTPQQNEEAQPAPPAKKNGGP